MGSDRSALVWVLLSVLCGAGCAPAKDSPAAAEAGRRSARAAATLPSGSAAERWAGPPPEVELAVDDVLLITVDTLRADALGFMGADGVATPNLDRLAAEGWVFEDAHAHNVVTLPSHANILTGRLPFSHGVRDNQGFRLPDGLPTAGTLLAEAGFATAAFVAAFPLDARFGLDRGFAAYDDRLEGAEARSARPLERSAPEVVAAAMKWWEGHAGQRRFLWLHCFDPHAPYEPPAGVRAGSAYLGEIAAVDSALGPLLERLRVTQDRRTFVVFTADHGEALGEHGELTHGLFAYESTLRVPLVLWSPDLPAGRFRAAARHVDLLPTILEATGVTSPPGLDGRSLLSAADPSAVTYFESLTPTLDRGWAPLRGVIRDGWKYVDLPIPELYDLMSDPAEKRNLYAAEPDLAASLASLVPEASGWPAARGEITEEEARSLRALGYLGGRTPVKTEFTADDDPKRLVELDAMVHEMIDAFERGRLDEAERLGRAVLGRRPDMGVASYYLAQVQLEAGKLRDAIEVMAAAYSGGSATPALVRQLGLSLAEAGDFRRAGEVLRGAAESGGVDDWNALGRVLSESGDQEGAERAFARVFALDARNAEAHQYLALAALRRGDWRGAGVEAEKALELNRSLGLAWSYLGSARYNLGNRQGALEAWERAVEIDPKDFDALYNIGLVGVEVGAPAKARAALERFLREAPPGRYSADFDDARRRLASLTDGR